MGIEKVAKVIFERCSEETNTHRTARRAVAVQQCIVSRAGREEPRENEGAPLVLLVSRLRY